MSVSNNIIRKRKNMWSLRVKSTVIVSVSLSILVGMLISSFFITPDKLVVDLQLRNIAPSLEHLFGTDWMGRDMLARTLKGLSLSFGVGLLSVIISSFIALLLSLLTLTNKAVDVCVTWLIDLFLSVPHIVLLILIAFTLGGGFKGVVIGLAVTHWPSLTRLLRAEVLQINSAEYVAISQKLGKTKAWVAAHHVLPHLLPQLLIGSILLFPHAILHEAAITFLGFGLSPETPAIGIILSEAMRYLSTGMWWLALFPGLALLVMVGIFDILGRQLQKWIDPFSGDHL
ncbi:ABC transporter permease [Sporosarcina sp. BI001-red]|uniref:ABC transporter permease n=1 Tax=Sporosarcina sp. BI001-red TaxID=2282866 RepID=UPI000E2465D1|nr:ABC transporter permease [Sporosarcina sp. BI001-red]REB06100.1 ABC transporter permease [Sporosarcina sp. BI001-red]